MASYFIPNPNLQRNIEKKLEKGLDKTAEIYEKAVKRGYSGPTTSKSLSKRTGKLHDSVKTTKGILKRTISTGVEYAMANEFGVRTAKKTIPARPVWRGSLKANKEKMLKQFRNIV